MPRHVALSCATRSAVPGSLKAEVYKAYPARCMAQARASALPAIMFVFVIINVLTCADREFLKILFRCAKASWLPGYHLWVRLVLCALH
eukprot:356625-Chlamydomonas_euryale.AAC.5